jgi:HEAT repeat protein
VTSSPRDRVEDACRRRGHALVVHGCRTLLAGGTVDPELIITLGGPAARRYLDDGEPEEHSYWLRVWAARGLLWAGPVDSTAALREVLDDEHWRVREMACKVVARHRLGELLDRVAAMETDANARVRAAAARAVSAIVVAEA